MVFPAEHPVAEPGSFVQFLVSARVDNDGDLVTHGGYVIPAHVLKDGAVAVIEGENDDPEEQILARGNRRTLSVFSVEHKHGTNITLHKDHAAAFAAVVEFVDDWWAEEMGTLVRPEDDEAAVEQYFTSTADRESYTIEDDLPVMED